MDLTNKSVIKELLKKYNAKPAKYLGQHFILSKKALASMIAAAEVKENDTIVEIGPGLGTLTQELAKNPACRQAGGANVIAIEKDPLMNKILKETLDDYKNVEIIQADARQLLMSDINSFGDNVGINWEKNGYKIVANLPYNAATFLIRRWLESKKPPKTMVLMIQKEVAQRIVAKPPQMNLLGVSVRFYANVKIIDYVKKESFWPKPKVDAAIIKVIPKKMTVSQRSPEKQHFFNIVKAGFSSPRKQLIGNLSKKLNTPKEKVILIFRNLDISETARAENLTLEQWQNLASQLIHN